MREIAQDKVDEFLKCRKSFEYFCKNYVYLNNNKLKPHVIQSGLIDFIEKEKYIIVQKERQIDGITTTMQIYCSWISTCFEDITIGIISRNDYTATTFIREIKRIIKNLPVWMQPEFEKYNKHSYVLKNGNKVISESISSIAPDKSFIGRTINLLIIDEAAFIKNIEKAWDAIVPALAVIHKISINKGIYYGCIILSSKNPDLKIGKWFDDMYTKSTTDSSCLFKSFGDLK